ncbi:hypothetical protein B0H13DRAFT_2650469 [Mycena leptocephala]|nr:hypothetical protein B0H13DRAFT_2650469 [Mycena leptocephala]
MPPKKSKASTASDRPAAPPKAKGKRKVPGGHAGGANSDYEENAAPPKRRRQAAVVAPRSPLPAREGRGINERRGINLNIAVPDKSRAKRSSAEVAHAKSRKEANLREIAELERLKLEKLAQMELDEEEEEEEEESMINTVADLERMDTIAFARNGALMDDELADVLDNFPMMMSDDGPYIPMSNSRMRAALRSGLEATGQTLDDPESSSSESEPQAVVKRPQPKKKNGGARESIEATKQELKKRQNIATNSKLQPMQLFPHGMDKDWRKQLKASAEAESYKPSKKASKLKADDDVFVGGLTDWDSAGQRPSSSKGKKPLKAVTFTGANLERNQNRANDNIVFVDSSDDDGLPPYPAPKKKAQRKHIKAEPGSQLQPLQPQSSVMTVATPSPDIPSDIAASWDRKYHPALLLLLATSPSAWDITAAQIAAVFHKTYPESSFDILAAGNRVMKRSRDRLNNGRSWFPTQAHIVVEEFFEQERFTELKPSLRKQKIAQYAAEAVLPEGHMLWSGPQLLPAGAPLYKASISIRAATGFCESEFVVGVLTPFLKKIAGASPDFRFLVSGVALAAAALEKEFAMYSTGEYVTDGQQFSRDNVGSLVDDYATNIKAFTIRKWDSILRCCGSVPQVAPISAGPSMTTTRRVLYISSSPVHGS